MISLLLLVVSTGSDQLVESACDRKCPPIKEKAINVHLVAHSHDDTGYRKTVDDYYYGLRNDASAGGIQYTIESVLDALERNPSRIFNQVEIAFFWRWWREASNRDRARMTRLIHNGQFNFLLGGWCMNDEALVSYKDMIEQNGLGLRWLRDTFGCASRPRAAWQIDTFGHTRGQAEMFSFFGYDALYFARLDLEELAERVLERNAEVIWKGKSSLVGSSLHYKLV